MTSARRAPEVITFGEAMAMFVAATPGSLDEVTHYSRSLAGAETNVATGLARTSSTEAARSASVALRRTSPRPYGRWSST